MTDKKRQQLLELFETAISTAHPQACLTQYLPDISGQGEVIVLGAGKACAAMVRALENHYENSELQNILSGAAVTRYGYHLPTKYIPLSEASHPIPDQESMKAAEQALQLANNAKENDLILVLLSGGASALWAAPIPGITLSEQQILTKNLLKSGATIEEINCVRKHLSRIKGGRLAAAAYPANIVTFSISDVPKDDIASIGSGPTVGDPTSCEDALKTLNTYEIDIPSHIKTMLADGSCESIFPNDKLLEKSEYHLIATPQMALEAASKKLKEYEYSPLILGDSIEGEAKKVAKDHAQKAKELKKQGKPVALLSGGELTVKITGSGKGGPNQEYALALAIELGGTEGIYAMAGDTDGTDGGVGAADDPAGAIVTPDTLSKAEQRGMDAALFLENNDSGGFFEKLDDLIVCGPTQTNINDFRVILIDP